MPKQSQRGINTRSVHTEVPYYHPNSHVMPPYRTSTYAMASLDAIPEFKYPRIDTPNGIVLAEAVVSLEEGGEAGAVMADGMRAISVTLMEMLSWGENRRGTIVSTTPLYSDTYRYFTHYLAMLGKQCAFLYSPIFFADDFRKCISEALARQSPVEILFIETPANPTLTVWDIKELSAIAHAHDILVIVDSTFGTPYNQSPLKLGADLVIHSLTKYISGNGTTLGGVVIGSSKRIAKIKERGRTEGGHLDPDAATHIQVGLQTFGQRIPQQNENAMRVAQFLNSEENRKKISKVYYPGLPSHESHEIAKAQMQTSKGCPGFGGMVSFELARAEWINPFGDYLIQETFIECAVSLGSTGSIFSVPALHIHAGLSAQERHVLGISDTLIRFSVGIEESENIIGALADALDAIEL